MPKTHVPRRGSLQFWPRKRAKKETPRVRSWAKVKEPKLLGFAGYKAGMTHVMIVDNKATSLTKGEEIMCPVTVLECPPLKAVSVRFYKKTTHGLAVSSEVFADNLDKELSRKMRIPKSSGENAKKLESVKAEDYDDIRLLMHTQPKLTGIGKKKPELFEIALGGTMEEKLNYAKQVLGKEVSVKDVFKEGELVDVHAVTKGKGFQGPVKRFGIGLKSHKSEKGRRAPGSLGPWNAQTKIMWRVAHAGKMGYHLRTEYNKWLIKIGEKPEEINPAGGFVNYGIVKNEYVLVKGSVIGPKKRLIRFNHAIRPSPDIPKEAPRMAFVKKDSNQG